MVDQCEDGAVDCSSELVLLFRSVRKCLVVRPDSVEGFARMSTMASIQLRQHRSGEDRDGEQDFGRQNDCHHANDSPSVEQPGEREQPWPEERTNSLRREHCSASLPQVGRWIVNCLRSMAPSVR